MSSMDKCCVADLVVSGDDQQTRSWLLLLDEAGLFQTGVEHGRIRTFTDWETQTAAELFRQTRCCSDLATMRHSDGRSYCLFHLPTFAKDRDQFAGFFAARLVRLDRETNLLSQPGTAEAAFLRVKNAYDFRHFWFPGDAVTFSGHTFRSPVSFEGARFAGAVTFSDCSFSGDADFSKAIFAGGAEFERCQFAGEARFTGAEFGARILFRDNDFRGDADFSGIRAANAGTRFSPNWNANFERQTFGGSVRFSNAVLPPKTFIEDSTCASDADLDGIDFGELSLKGTSFAGRVNFARSQFLGPLDFANTIVTGDLDFAGAHFAGYQSFTGFHFPKKADFAGAKFTLAATFIYCDFGGEANFDTAVFESTASFSRAVFRESASFIRTRFRWHTNFDDAEFCDEVKFAAEFSKHAEFDRTTFSGAACFGVREQANSFNEQTVFTAARFLAPVDFTYSTFNFSINKFAEVDFSQTIGLPDNLKIPQKIKMKADLIVHNCGQLVTCAGNGTVKKGAEMRELRIIEQGAVAIYGNRIAAVGRSDEILRDYEADEMIDAGGRVAMPAFVDPHTHIIYAGNRLNEFELKIKGADYLEILANGGGILSTVRHTRTASNAELVEQTLKRLDKMLAHGTATAEIKTGYGLDEATEFKMLDVWDELDRRHPIYLVPTFLPAHAVPPEFKNDPAGYVDLVCETMIPKLVDWRGNVYLDPDRIDFDEKRAKPFFVDVFCERNAFDLAESKRILETAKAHNFKLKAHVDEFTNLGGSRLCIELGAVSIDHLDAISDDEIALLAGSETVGIVTPTVNFNFGSAHFADARRLIDSGCAVALSTDYNPGSAPCPSQQTAMQIACRYQKLLPAEAITAATLNAAYSIGLGERTGSLEVGKWADLVILDTDDYREVCYEFGSNFVRAMVKNGRKISDSRPV